MPRQHGIPSSRGWCFTINNPDADYAETLIGSIPHKYIVFQEERGAQGTTHVQGYVYFANAKQVQAVSRMGPFRHAHLEIARGTAEQNRDYCTKEDTRVNGPWEDGTIPMQGKSNAARELVSAIVNLDVAVEEIAEEDLYTYVRCEKMMKAARMHALKKKCRSMGYRDVRTLVIWGKPGVGKSRLAAWIGSQGDHRCYRIHQPIDVHTRWAFNEYDGEDTLIIEDAFFQPERIPEFLKILDGYFYHQYAMYGWIYPCWTRVIITANTDVYKWSVSMQSNEITPLQRRLTHCYEMDMPTMWNADGSPELPYPEWLDHAFLNNFERDELMSGQVF